MCQRFALEAPSDAEMEVVSLLALLSPPALILFLSFAQMVNAQNIRGPTVVCLMGACPKPRTSALMVLVLLGHVLLLLLVQEVLNFALMDPASQPALQTTVALMQLSVQTRLVVLVLLRLFLIRPWFFPTHVPLLAHTNAPTVIALYLLLPALFTHKLVLAALLIQSGVLMVLAL